MPPSERLSAAGYTRESVESYLDAVARERQGIEQSIADARAREDLALRRSRWLDELTPGADSLGDDVAASIRGGPGRSHVDE
ncbi:MAG TPA: hypothetical protein VEJ44_01460 [Acidimicrobiales bacterium]|nr:hypothetical protein [Acidimicrobiales bacterium]